MPSVGRVHFETYTAQNRVKHAILSKYFGAYLTALSGAALLAQQVFFGSRDAADAALACSPTTATPNDVRLLEIYLKSVRERSAAKYVLPFRFQAAERERTSHYLLHLAQHPLAFKS